jgi:hypothetical protein
MKCFGFKEISKNVQQISANGEGEEAKASAGEEGEEKAAALHGCSDFCRINP